MNHSSPEDEIVKERPRIVNVPTTNQYPPSVQRNSPTKPIQKIVPESTDQVTPAVTNVLMRETHETESQHKTNILQEGVIRSVVSLMKDRFLHPFDAESLFILNNWYKYLNSTQNQSESPSVPDVLHETENFVMANLNLFWIARATVPISRMFVQELLMANLDAYKDLLNQLLSTDNRTGEWCNRLYETLTACVQASNPRNKLPANSILNDGNPTIAEPLHSMPNLEVTEQIPQQRPIPKPRNAKPRATRAQANSRDTTSSSASGPRYTSPPHYQQFDKVPPQFNQRMYFPFNCSVPNTGNYPNGIPPLAPQQMGMPMVNPALLYGSHSESLAQQLQQQQMLMAMMKQTSRYSYPAGQSMLNPMMDSRPLLVNRANDEQGHPAVNSVPEPHQAMQNLRIPVINIPASHVAANVQLMQPEHRINYVPHDTNQSMMIHLIEPQKAVPHQATVNRPIQPRQVNAPVSATTQSLSGLGTVSAPASATTQSLSGLGTVHQTDSQHPMNPSLEQRRINEAHNPPTFEPRAMVAQKTVQSAVISEYNVQEATRSKAKPVPVICRPQTSESMRVSVTNSTEQSKQITQQTNLNPVIAILYIPEVSPDARGAVKRWIDENTPVSGVNQEKLLAMDSGTQQSSYYVPLHDIHHMPVPITSGISANAQIQHHVSADGVGGNIRVSENGSTTIGGSALRNILISGNSSTTTSTTVSGRSNAGSSSKPCTMTSASITEPTKVSASTSQPTETAQSTEKHHDSAASVGGNIRVSENGSTTIGGSALRNIRISGNSSTTTSTTVSGRSNAGLSSKPCTMTSASITEPTKVSASTSQPTETAQSTEKHHDSADGVGGNIRMSENGSTTIGGSALRIIRISGNSSTTTSTTVSGRSNAGSSSKPCTMTSASITEPTKVSASTSQPTETAQSTEKHHDSAASVGGNIRVSENGSTTIGGSALRNIRISGNSSTTTSTTVSGRSNAGLSSKPCTMTSASITEPTKVSASTSQPTETAQSTEKHHDSADGVGGNIRMSENGSTTIGGSALRIIRISGNSSTTTSTTVSGRSNAGSSSKPCTMTSASITEPTKVSASTSQPTETAQSTEKYHKEYGPMRAPNINAISGNCSKPVSTTSTSAIGSLPFVNSINIFGTRASSFQATRANGTNSQTDSDSTLEYQGSRGSQGSSTISPPIFAQDVEEVIQTNVIVDPVKTIGRNNLQSTLPRVITTSNLSTQMNEDLQLTALKQENSQRQMIHTENGSRIKKVAETNNAAEGKGNWSPDRANNSDDLSSSENELRLIKAVLRDQFQDRYSEIVRKVMLAKEEQLKIRNGATDELDDAPKRFKSDGFDKGNVDINPELTKSDTKTLKLSLPVIEDISSDDDTTTAGSATNQETDLQFRVRKAGENISPNQALDHAGKANGGLQTSALTSSMPKGPDAPLPDAWQTWLAEERLRGNSLFAPFYGSPQSIETISSAGSDYTPRMNADEFEIRIDSKWYRVKKDIYDRIPKGKLYYEPDRKEFVRYFDDDQIEQFRRNTSDLGHMKASVESNAETFGLPPDPSEVTFSNQDRFSDPVMFVEEMQNVKQYVPKDFYGFYLFVAGYQIVRHHWPITFCMFLLLHNTNRIKKLLYDYVNALMQGLCLH
nr:unnamed protein product [Callosobruchus chinensis]